MADSAEARGLVPDDLYQIPVPSDPQLSPDGSRVVYVVTVADRGSDRDLGSLWEVPAAGGPPQRVTWDGSCSAPRWSPDGRWLAFLRASDSVQAGAPQLWLLPAGGEGRGEARRLTDLPGGAGSPAWSPDSSTLAFEAPAGGSAGRRHLHLVPIEGDAPGSGVRQLTAGDFSASAPAWSPDGTELAFTADLRDSRDLRPGPAVYLIAATGGTPRQLTGAGASFTATAFSPDGQALLLVGLERTGVGHQRLFTLPRDGGDPIELAPGFDRNVMIGLPAYPGARPRYGADGRQVYFCARDQGRVHVLSVPAAGGEPRLITGGDRVAGGMSIVGGRLAVAAATASSPGEIFLTDLDSGAERQLTDLFAGALPDVQLVPPRPRTFTAPDGTAVHGWILRGGNATGPSPLLLAVHGGPHNAWGPAFDPAHLYQQALAAEGWTVLCVNSRGSDGYGERFWQALTGGWGRADQQDQLTAVDAVVAEGLADPGKLAVTGYSYGGFMTCWLTAHTDRFAAAVAGGCLSDLVSAVGTSDEGWVIGTLEMGGDRQLLAELSPLSHVDGVSAPTLLLHGENDAACPVGQAEEWLTALRAREVPAELVRYPGASHEFILDGRPSHRVDYCRRLQAWICRAVRPRQPGSAGRAVLRTGSTTHWQQRLKVLARQHRVPGASLAILAGDEIIAAASGVLNAETGVEATPDSLFQIGSITKSYTASLAMQLVDEGLVALDEPVVNKLEDFQLADSVAVKQITLRHLLTHTSGIEGDHFLDTGRGDDALERYVASCARLGLSHPVGATFSYCNTGYMLAGRLVELLTGMPWREALRVRLLEPLGLRQTTTLPEEAMRFRVAFGHEVEGNGPPRLAPTWMLPYSAAAAGSTVCATASDLVRFARMHLDGGLSPDGARVMPADSVEAMQRPEVALPDPWTLGSHWGLGWILFDWDGGRVFGHDGGTLGQRSFLRVVPDAGVAVALLTNGGSDHDLYHDLCGEVLAEMCGTHMPESLAPPAAPVPVDPGRYAGVYERVGVRIELTPAQAGSGPALAGRLTYTGPLAALVDDPVTNLTFTPVREDLFVTRSEDEQTWTPVVFYSLPDGSRYLHMGARATPKLR